MFRNFMKGAVAFLLAFCLLMLGGCGVLEGSMNNSALKKQGYYTEYDVNHSLEVYYRSLDQKQIKEDLDKDFAKINTILNKNDNSNASSLLQCQKNIYENLLAIADHVNLNYVEFSKTPSNKSVLREYQKLNEYYNDKLSEFYGLYGKIYESNYSKSFFNGWSKKQIDEVLWYSKTYTKEFMNLNDRRDEYVLEYQSLDPNGLFFSSKSANLYKKIVKCNRNIAMLAGYDSYSEYADERLYSRDLTAKNRESLYKHSATYLFPLAMDLYSKVQNAKNASEVQEQIRLLSGYDCSMDLMKEKLEIFTLRQGVDFQNSFKDFQDSITTASSKKSSAVAFTAFLERTNHAVCYFGKGYQSLSTYVHELGHFNSYNLGQHSYQSIDLCETHSQTNEWLYIAYLEECYEDKELYQGIVDYYLLNQLVSMALAISCDRFERAIYSDPDVSFLKYDQLFIKCVKEAGAYELLSKYMGSNLKKYWHYAVVGNSMYYLSYANSTIPCLQIYIDADSGNFERACEKYLTLCKSEYTDHFQKAVSELQMSAPFDEKSYKTIYNHFNANESE